MLKEIQLRLTPAEAYTPELLAKAAASALGVDPGRVMRTDIVRALLTHASDT